MNARKTIFNLKSFFGKKTFGAKRAITLDKIWRIEIIAAVILLLVFLAFDFWIYQNFILKQPDLLFGRKNAVSFKKSDIDGAAKKIDDYADFLKNPSSPFAENPF